MAQTRKERLRDEACHAARRAAVDLLQAANYAEESKMGPALDNVDSAAKHANRFVDLVKAYASPRPVRGRLVDVLKNSTRPAKAAKKGDRSGARPRARQTSVRR